MKKKSVPIVEFVSRGRVVSTVNVNMTTSGDVIRIGLSVEPSTRVGRPLPDWPEALSLRGGASPDRRN